MTPARVTHYDPQTNTVTAVAIDGGREWPAVDVVRQEPNGFTYPPTKEGDYGHVYYCAKDKLHKFRPLPPMPKPEPARVDLSDHFGARQLSEQITCLLDECTNEQYALFLLGEASARLQQAVRHIEALEVNRR